MNIFPISAEKHEEGVSVSSFDFEQMQVTLGRLWTPSLISATQHWMVTGPDFPPYILKLPKFLTIFEDFPKILDFHIHVFMFNIA